MRLRLQRHPLDPLPTTQHDPCKPPALITAEAGGAPSVPPMSGERRLSLPQLEQLLAMRSQLDAGQLDSLQALETLQTRLQTNQTNIELFHINPSLALASPLRSARETLERKASFLMASPIVGHI